MTAKSDTIAQYLIEIEICAHVGAGAIVHPLRFALLEAHRYETFSASVSIVERLGEAWIAPYSVPSACSKRKPLE